MSESSPPLFLSLSLSFFGSREKGNGWIDGGTGGGKGVGIPKHISIQKGMGRQITDS